MNCHCLRRTACFPSHMSRIVQYLRGLPDRQMVRPWALAVPILVLLIAAPMLRPLRHPMLAQISRDEVTRLATVQAIVEHRTIDLSQTGTAVTPYGYAPRETAGIRQPPMLAALLSPTYWVLHRSGTTMDDNPHLVAYLLTLLGVTIPVALAAGLVYRMGRLFELKRHVRTALAGLVVFASGLISYATVLNPHAPAATLVLAGSACLIHVAIISRRPSTNYLWMIVAGFCFAMAAMIDPPAVIFLILMGFVVLAMRWKIQWRVAGLACYLIGASIPISAHLMMAGELGPYFLPAELRGEQAVVPALPVIDLDAEFAIDPEPQGTFNAIVLSDVGKLAAALAGTHGLLSHFPILVLGLFGVAAVMHRHWAVSTKVFATATVGGAVVIIVGCVIWLVDWSDAMFAVRWFVVFTPLLLFWAGAWMRHGHRPATWAIVGALALFSICVSLIGATNPLPRNGYSGYSAAGALRALQDSSATDTAGLLADVSP